MKLEIDLGDILRDENGDPEESLQESIRRQIVDRMSGDLRKRLFQRMDEELSRVMSAQLRAAVEQQMPALLEDVMNTSYTPISKFGEKGQSTTFRAELVRAVAENMKYQPRAYASEENAFTKAVRSILEAQMDAIRKEIVSAVDVKFKQDAIAFAVKQLSERLGLSKP